MAERGGEGGEFDRVAERGGGAVRLDVADGRGVDLGHQVRGADHLGLPGDAGGGEAHLVRAVVVDGGAADHGVDVIAVREGLGEALEHDDADAVGADRAAGLRVEGPAVAVRRDDPALGVLAEAQRHVHRGPARQREVALPRQQRLRRDVDRDQRGGAGRLHGDRGPGEPELVSDS